jgi:carbonic anhydrase
MTDPRSPGSQSRRQFLRATAAFAAVGAAAQTGVRLSSAEPPHRPPLTSPDAPIPRLMAGNQRYVANRQTSHDFVALRHQTEEQQQPFAAVLACADSRVPVEVIFDQSIGDVFVTRVAGNIATSEIIGSLEYGVAVLGVSAILVLGHSHCGALKAAVANEDAPGQITSLYPHLRAAVEKCGGNVEAAIAANARIQAELLRNASTVIRQAVTAGKLTVASGVYDLGSGVVSI